MDYHSSSGKAPQRDNERTEDMKVKVTVEIEIPNDYHPDMAAAIVAKGLQENSYEGLQNWQIVEVGRPTLEVQS